MNYTFMKKEELSRFVENGVNKALYLKMSSDNIIPNAYTDEKAAEINDLISKVTDLIWEATDGPEKTTYDEEYSCAMFTMDEFPDVIGYTTGAKWNGWECPLFTKQACMQIQKAYDHVTEDETLLYNELKDTFYILHDKDDINYENGIEEYEGYDISIGGQAVHVYPLGQYSWTWETAFEY